MPSFRARSKLLLGLLLVPFAQAALAQQPHAIARIGLPEALQSAEAHAPEVKAAEAARVLREAQLDSAEAAWLPKLSLEGSGGYRFDNRLVLPGAPRIDSRSLTADGSAALEWTALDFARGSRIAATEALARAEDLSATATRERVRLLAAERYVHAAATSALVRDAEIALARRQEQERAIDDLVRAGTRSPLDLARAKIETLTARYALEASKRDELVACALLAVAIGRPATQPVCARDDGLARLELDASGLEGTQPRERPELQARAATVSARREAHAAAIAERLPSLSVAGNAQLSYLDVRRGAGIDGHQYGGAALVVLRWSGLDPVIWSRAGETDAAVALAEREWEAMQQMIASEAVTSAHAVARAQIELARATEVLAAAESARDAQAGRYQAGLASMLELLDAERLAQDARRARIEAARAHQLAGARCLFVQGRLQALAR